MKSNIFRVSFALFLITLIICCADALAQNRTHAAEVSGSFTVRNIAEPKTVELKYVYAEWSGAEDRISNQKAILELIFSDQPILVEDGLERLRYIMMMSAEGKLNALRVELRPDKTVRRHETYFDGYLLSTECLPPDDLRNMPPHAQVMAGLGCKRHFFEAKTFTDEAVSGTVRSSQLFQGGYDSVGAVWEYQITFRAKINKPTARYEGTDAELARLEREYTEFYQAAISQNPVAVRKRLSSANVQLLEGAEAAKRLAQLKTLMQPLKEIKHLDFYAGGKSAYVRIGEKQAPINRSAPPSAPQKEMQGRMLLEGGVWKMDWLVWDNQGDESNLLWHLDSDGKKVISIYRHKDIAPIINGSPLPAGGGDAGKAYLEFCQAVKSGDKKSLLKFLHGWNAAYLSDPRVGADYIVSGKPMRFASMTVLGGTSKADRAVLQVQSQEAPHYRATGKVNMYIENGQWKIVREVWEVEYLNQAPARRRK